MKAPGILFRIFCCITLFIGIRLGAQRNYVGVRAGMANLVGDVGRTAFLFQKPMNVSEFGLPVQFELSYGKNFNPYQTLRADFSISHVQFSDLRSKEDYRHMRGAGGTNTVYALDVMFEYNFLPVNLEDDRVLSPYIFGGLGPMAYSNKRVTIKEANSRLKEGRIVSTIVAEDELFKDFKLSIPFGAGLRYKFNMNWAITGELKFRYTNSDSVDYSRLSGKNIHLKSIRREEGNPTDASVLRQPQGNNLIYDHAKLGNKFSHDEIYNALEAQKNKYISEENFGNLHDKDWINAITLGITYYFGWPHY
ncbi:outer membrane beta-barrel protein [Cruoricaptor ignavus]|uniref:Outer membrane beta-barrel protein n=1 Tax=Cruoricaptor ignavus TaxID=1118202 RepID=A0A7M1T0X1_9FLAO|nr:DUF6089 family protein [Cruoricaptor ignavus]QOR73449.1 outer membrane beta-barrel protein [Cruoricaptor ignavus]